MRFGSRSTVESQRIRLHAPDPESESFIETLRRWSRLVGRQLYRRYAFKCSRVLDRCIEEPGRNTLSTPLRTHEHTPDVRYVGGFDLFDPVNAEHSDQPLILCSEHH